MSHHSPNDAIRIVPLHRPDAQALAPPAAPKLTYRSGPLITSVEIFTIFWGTRWRRGPLAEILAQMNQFFDFVLTSSLMDQLSEYSVAGHSIGQGKRTGTMTLTTPEPSASMTDQAIQQLLQREISSNGAFPQPSPNILSTLSSCRQGQLSSKVEVALVNNSAAITMPLETRLSTQ